MVLSKLEAPSDEADKDSEGKNDAFERSASRWTERDGEEKARRATTILPFYIPTSRHMFRHSFMTSSSDSSKQLDHQSR